MASFPLIPLHQIQLLNDGLIVQGLQMLDGLVAGLVAEYKATGQRSGLHDYAERQREACAYGANRTPDLSATPTARPPKYT